MSGSPAYTVSELLRENQQGVEVLPYQDQGQFIIGLPHLLTVFSFREFHNITSFAYAVRDFSTVRSAVHSNFPKTVNKYSISPFSYLLGFPPRIIPDIYQDSLREQYQIFTRIPSEAYQHYFSMLIGLFQSRLLTSFAKSISG